MNPLAVSFSAQDLAHTLNGSVVGDPALTVTGLCSLYRPEPNHLAFIRTRSTQAAIKQLQPLPQMIVLIEQSILPPAEIVNTLKCVLIVVEHAQSAYVKLIPEFFESETVPRSIHPTVIIDPTAVIGRNVALGPFCNIGPGAKIGDDSTLHHGVVLYRDAIIGKHSELHSGVVIRESCVIGDYCIVHNNTVIGADGFGYISDPSKGIIKVPQVGIVKIGDYVEIGAGAAIDRATVGATIIGSHTKIDNHVQIGHNVEIGSHCILCAQVGIAGSVRVGNGVVLGGGTGVADHITIASGVRVGGHSGVTGSIDEPGDYMGMPAIKAALYRRQQASLKRLAKSRESNKQAKSQIE